MDENKPKMPEDSAMIVTAREARNTALCQLANDVKE
jgi:hypothetical protein